MPVRVSKVTNGFWRSYVYLLTQLNVTTSGHKCQNMRVLILVRTKIAPLIRTNEKARDSLIDIENLIIVVMQTEVTWSCVASIPAKKIICAVASVPTKFTWTWLCWSCFEHLN